MSLIGKIVTLFSDKEKTAPVFPRTKTSAITNDEGIELDTLLENAGIVPAPTIEDNGKFLQVVDGMVSWVDIEDAEGVEV